jgi:hypothetical protein
MGCGLLSDRDRNSNQKFLAGLSITVNVVEAETEMVWSCGAKGSDFVSGRKRMTVESKRGKTRIT